MRLKPTVSVVPRKTEQGAYNMAGQRLARQNTASVTVSYQWLPEAARPITLSQGYDTNALGNSYVRPC
jgi:hypothetical protein